jgi:hypothetical protein
MLRSTQQNWARPAAWRTADSVSVVLFGAGSLALSLVTIIRRPDLVKGAEFLFGETGHNLLVADRLLAGQFLYRDVFYQYGLLPAYAYALAAGLFGNAPMTYLVLLAAISAVNLCLAYVLVRRATSTTTAIITSAGLLALVPIPGALAGAFTLSPYLVLERTLLLLVALCWRPPESRGLSRVALGMTLGLWQGVKFGGGVVAGGTVLALDVLYLVSAGYSGVRVKALLRATLLMGAAFTGVELLWVFLATRTAWDSLALDILWPSYILRSYHSMVSANTRWPHWYGWRLAVGQYLLPLSAAGLGVIGLVDWLRAGHRDTSTAAEARWASGGVFIPLMFFGLSCLGYFQQVYHFQQFLWALVPAAAWAIWRYPLAARPATVLAWSPGVLLVLRSAFVTLAPHEMADVSLPSGGSIVVNSAMADRLSFLRRFTAEETHGSPVLYSPVGSGWLFAYGVPSATRNIWFFSSSAVRPYEREDFVRALDRTPALITCNEPGGALPTMPAFFPLPPEIASSVYRRLELWKSEAGCRVYRVRPTS